MACDDVGGGNDERGVVAVIMMTELVTLSLNGHPPYFDVT